MLINKIKYYIYRYILKFIFNDFIFIKLKYFIRHNKIPDLVNPKTFNERIAHFKLNERSSLHTMLADKYAVKEYVMNKIGSKYVLKNLYVTSNPSSINFEKLPNSFIIKATHGSSSNIIVTDKNKISKKKIIAECEHFLSINYYYYGREWHARDIKPQIIIEKLMLDERGNVPLDYKLFTFNGKVEVIQVDIGRFKKQRRNFYNTKWEQIPVELNHPKYDGEIKKPDKLNEMINIANQLSHNLHFARIDLYYHLNTIYFGEITLTPGNNLEKFKPEKYDKIFGNYYNAN